VSPAQARLTLRLFGAAVLQSGDSVERPLDRHGALIAARLALAGPQARGVLAAWLWPDAQEARARANLRQRLLRLKALAGREWIVGDAVLQLSPAVQVASPEANGGGELLAGIAVSDDEPAGAWLQQARALQRARHLQALAVKATAAETGQHWADAVAAVQQMVALEPQSEVHHRQLMRLHYLSHDLARARSAYLVLERVLRDEFAARPSAESQALYALIQQATEPPSGLAGKVSARTSAALLRPPQWIGRIAERAALSRQLEARAAVLLLGEAGMGKSRLLAEVLRGRQDVLRVKAELGDVAVPYATLTRLLPGGPAGVAVWSLAAVAHALTTTREGQAVTVVAVDDLHFADEASIEMLQALATDAGTPEHPPQAWLFTQRPGEATPASQRLRDALIAARRLVELPLSPLDVAQMKALLESLALPGLDPQTLAPRLVQHTGGNPLFALETLKHVVDGGGPVQALPLPLTISTLIERRLQRLSELALALARVAAVAGPDFQPALAACVLDRPALGLASAWAELESAQVLCESAFAHDLVADAARRSVPRAVARHLHGAVAEWLQSRGGEPARVAAHWLAAARPEQAAHWLAQAAHLAHQQLRPREEARFLEQLVDCVEAADPAMAVRTLMRLARAQTEAQGFAATAALLQRALHLATDGVQRLPLLNLMAETQLNRLMPGASALSAAAAFAQAQAIPDETGAAEAVVRWHRALCMSGQGRQAQALWAEQQPWMAAVTLPSAELVSDRGWVLDRLGRPREARQWHQAALVRVRRAGRPVDEAVVMGNLAQGHLLSGEPVAAEAAVDRADRLSHHHDGLHAASDYLALYRAMAAAARGRYGDALGHFERALADAAAQSPQARLAVLAHRALLWAAIGQRGRAQADASAVLAEANEAAFIRAHAHHAMALATQVQGQSLQAGLQRALDALDDEAQRAFDGPIRLKLLLAAAADDAASAGPALKVARGLLRHACAQAHPGLRWSAHWAAAQLATTAGHPLAARRHALACAARPPDEVASACTEGQWWHGLWRVWTRLGYPVRAAAAREAGCAWMVRTQQQHLPAPFHISFRDAVLAHRELLALPLNVG